MDKTRKLRRHAAFPESDKRSQQFDIRGKTAEGQREQSQSQSNRKGQSPALSYFCLQYDPDSEAEIEKEYAETRDISMCLVVHNMHCDRFRTMPKHLAALVASIKISRTGPPSPKSQEVAHANRFTSEMTEIDALSHLKDHLGYVPATAVMRDGEKCIFRTHSQLWSATSVPKLNTAHDDVLAAALGCPKPDIAYGYTTSSFSSLEIQRWLCLSPSARVTDLEPISPFLIFNWKSHKGNALHGRQQAMRDGAAAVNTLRQLFVESGTRKPREDDTAVFCVCVNSETIEIFVSWRRDHTKDGISWEMDSLYQGLLRREDMVFHARSILLNILDWARQQRLKRIKVALGR